MKKMIAILLSIGLLLCLVACGQEAAEPEVPAQRPPATSTEASSEASTEEEAVTTECTEPVKLDNRQKGPLCRIITTQGVLLCRNENTHI